MVQNETVKDLVIKTLTRRNMTIKEVTYLEKCMNM